ncbi:MAG: HD domain-containing phosphohydrolase [Sulfuriferula sp.]
MNKKPKLLVIDDDPNLRKTLADILRVKGYEVMVAADGAGGIAQAQHDFVSVALIDLKLPDMSGLEVMSQIKADSPLTEAIILTGHAAMESAIAATNQGAFSYLLKPYKIDDLLQHIRHAVERQQGQQEILRLASFPRIDPNPIIELDATGTLSYLNPAAEKLFPDLVALGMAHPITARLVTDISVIGRIGQSEMLDEVVFNGAVYEQHITTVPESDVFRAYMLDITQRKTSELTTKKLNAMLMILRDVNEYLLVAKNEQKLFQFVCDALNKFDDVVAVLIALKREKLKPFPVAWAGIGEAGFSVLQARCDDPGQQCVLFANAVAGMKPIVIDNAETDTQLADWQDVVQQFGIKSATAIPLSADKAIIGSLLVFSGQYKKFDEEMVGFFGEVARDVAIGVNSLRLGSKLKATLSNLKKSLDSTVEAISRIVEIRDPYTAGHESRVAQLSSAIGKALGLPERQLEGLHVIGHLHDIGKIAIPVEILSKPGRLSILEYEMIKTHPQAGYEILKNLDFPWPVAQAVLQHHERLDGSGYPQGLKGEDIILEARILMVADVVEAMASYRPYRPALGIDVALNEINTHKGMLFDARIVDVCVRLFTEQGFKFE